MNRETMFDKKSKLNLKKVRLHRELQKHRHEWTDTEVSLLATNPTRAVEPEIKFRAPVPCIWFFGSVSSHPNMFGLRFHSPESDYVVEPTKNSMNCCQRPLLKIVFCFYIKDHCGSFPYYCIRRILSCGTLRLYCFPWQLSISNMSVPLIAAFDFNLCNSFQ